MWIYLGLMSAFFLGFYNICKKLSVKDNAVLPVLWLTTFFGLLGVFPLYVVELSEIGDTSGGFLQLKDHLLLAVKSFMMSISWVLAFYALKHLPLTIVSPIRSASPFFTVIGAFLIYGESPHILQWLGVIVILFSMLLYSNIGKKEGIHFKNNYWVWAVVFATLLGASSGLYDKFLVQFMNYSTITIQFWFSFYLVVFIGSALLFARVKNTAVTANFQWRWSIPLVGLLLVSADYFYFNALHEEGTMIMLLSAIKRSQIFITVFIGGLIFKEKNKKKKIIPLLGVVLGVGLILYAG